MKNFQVRQVEKDLALQEGVQFSLMSRTCIPVQKCTHLRMRTPDRHLGGFKENTLGASWQRGYFPDPDLNTAQKPTPTRRASAGGLIWLKVELLKNSCLTVLAELSTINGGRDRGASSLIRKNVLVKVKLMGILRENGLIPSAALNEPNSPGS